MIWLKRLGAISAGLAVLAGLFAGWVWMRSAQILGKSWRIPEPRIEHPWPLDDQDLAELRAAALQANPPVEGEPPTDPLEGMDLAVIRVERSVARGRKHARRLGCHECHGEDLSGKVVMDVPPVMGIISPNITGGRGGLDESYTLDDFERIVRHGVTRGGRAALMPAVDTQWLSNKEVADLWAYVESVPAMDREMPPPYWGPIMRTLVAVGAAPLPSAYRIDHRAPRLKVPPDGSDPIALGRHLAQTCVNCHNTRFSGGPIADGDPDWPPAGNLTPHDDGIGAWSNDQFRSLMRTGKRPDGTEVDPVAMPWRAVGTLDDTELDALFAYLRTLEPAATGG